MNNEEPSEESRHGRGLWARLRRGLSKTQTELFGRLGAATAGRGYVDGSTLDDLEESLIAADVGVNTAVDLVEGVRSRVHQGQGIDIVALRQMLADEAAILLLDAPALPPMPRRRITLVVGVNGVGKTTTIAKLAARSQRFGESVLIAAGDTFRAAAIEQLVVWSQRLAVDLIRQKAGGDPAAVVFDALQAAQARQIDHVIVDTAGRLHTKSHLMEELAKIGRVIDREGAGYGRRTLLVVDATSGQNAVVQAKEFCRVVAVDGLVLTKLDGTAKGGVVLSIAHQLRLPVVYLGVGEGAEDLVDFNAREFARALFAPGVDSAGAR